MKVRFSVLVVCVLLGLTACSLDDGNPKTSIHSYAFDFTGPNFEWTHGFSDYPAGPDSARFELKYAYASMPPNLGDRKAIMLSGNSHNSDLFMFLKTKIPGLEPHRTYTLTINIELASSAKAGGTANNPETPGESVYVKVGATVTEPKSVIEGGNFVMNIDKGNGAQGGEDMVVIGNIAIPADANGFGLKTLNNSYSSYSPIRVSASSKGELWVIVGTDATQKGTTTLYYSKINIVLSGAE